MTRQHLSAMTVAQLVERFTAIALDQDRALLRGEIKKVNRLGEALHEVTEELKRREGDQRRALLPLYEHVNPQVQLKAVKATLAVVPGVALAALQAIADSNQFPQAGDAGMALLSLERGTYNPT